MIYFLALQVKINRNFLKKVWPLKRSYFAELQSVPQVFILCNRAIVELCLEWAKKAAEAYLGLCQMSMMEIFCENS